MLDVHSLSIAILPTNLCAPFQEAYLGNAALCSALFAPAVVALRRPLVVVVDGVRCSLPPPRTLASASPLRRSRRAHGVGVLPSAVAAAVLLDPLVKVDSGTQNLLVMEGGGVQGGEVRG